MFCHVSHVWDSYPVAVSGMQPPFPAGGPDIPPGCFGFPFSASGPPPAPSSLHSPRRLLSRRDGTLVVARVSRVCARARLRASCAGARFARGRKRPPDAAPDFRSRFILTRFAEMQAPLPDFSYFHRRSRTSGSPEFAAPASIRCLLPTLRPGCGEECRAREASAEPDQPDGDVEAVFLRAFEHVVLVGPLFPVR